MDRSPLDNLDDFTLEVARLNDEPLRPGDRVIFTEPYPGRIVIARAPIKTA
jgi:hypothetical protein